MTTISYKAQKHLFRSDRIIYFKYLFTWTYLFIEKLKTQIAEKEAEVANIEVIQDTTASDVPVENPTEENKDLKQD